MRWQLTAVRKAARVILADHNAHLKEIRQPAVPADPKLNIVGAPETTKWSGDVWAHLEDDQVEQIQGGQRIVVQQTKVKLPTNVPVTPAINDVIVLYKMRTGQTARLVVRDINERFWLLGFIQLICRVS